MAWNVKVRVDPATNRYRVDATRTDPVTGEVQSYWLEGILDTKLSREQRTLTIADNVRAQHEEAQAKKIAEKEVVGTLERDVAAALDEQKTEEVTHG